eukprot:763627-Prymnesium_polylepis.2
MVVTNARLRCLWSGWHNGSWVLDEDAAAPYTEQDVVAAKKNPQSRNIILSSMCNQTVQRSWKWRWRTRSSQCSFRLPTRTELCRRLAGVRLLLYGDSLTQQFFVSMVSLAGNGALASK